MAIKHPKVPKFLGAVSTGDNNPHNVWFVLRIEKEDGKNINLIAVTEVGWGENIVTKNIFLDKNVWSLYEHPEVKNTEILIKLFKPVPTENGWYKDKDGATWSLQDGMWHWKNMPGDIYRGCNSPQYNFAPFTKIKKPTEVSIKEFEDYIVAKSIHALPHNYNLMIDIKNKYREIFEL